jgi:pSer/pThr/pTyr-binding forkhead associated (FHA) protein
MARLVVLTEGFTGLSHELKAEKVTIGRVEDNAFQIAEASVSSHHCEVLQKGDDYVVKDLGSTNGTFIDGEQVTEAVLKPGHLLRLGQVEVRLETGVPGAAHKPLEKTMVLPQGGVKLNQFDTAAGRAAVETTQGFSKKDNKTTKIFVGIGIALGVVIVILLLLVFLRIGG